MRDAMQGRIERRRMIIRISPAVPIYCIALGWGIVYRPLILGAVAIAAGQTLTRVVLPLIVWGAWRIKRGG